MDRLLIVDTYAFLYRAFYAGSGLMKNSSDKSIGAYAGFFSTILYLLKETKCTHVVFASDSKSPSKRKLQYPEYKANRDRMPDDLREQVDLVKNALSSANITLQMKDGLEADDIIVSLANKYADKNTEVVIASGDKDILQAVSDEKHITLFRPPSFGNQWTVYNEAKIEEKYGIKKESIASYLSLLGDASDNVPGVKGIGIKGAVELLKEYKTLDNIYSNLDKIAKPKTRSSLENGKDDAYLSYSLVYLGGEDYDAGDINQYKVENINYAELINTLNNDGAHAIANRFLKFTKDSKIELNDVKSTAELDVFTFKKHTATHDDLKNALSTSNVVAVNYNKDTSNLTYTTTDDASNSININKSNIEIISKLITDYLNSDKNALVGFDLKTTIKAFYIGNVSRIKAHLYDIELMAYLLDSEKQHFPKSLLSEKYLSKTLPNQKKKESTLFESDEDEATAFHAPLSYALYSKLIADLKDKELLNYYETVEEKILPIIASIEKNGIYLDTKELETLKETLTKRIDKITDQIYALIGHPINISSPQQVGTVLFDELKIANGKKNKLGYSVSSEVLESLKDEHPIVPLILDYRFATKIRSTYTDSLINLVDRSDNRLHTTFLQTGTATGRFSSVSPNLQNIPVRSDEGRLTRMAFKSTEGNILLSADYAQIELVVLSHFSKDKNLISLFKSGEDVHKLTASLIFSKDKSEVTPSERRLAKTINFGVIYGMSAFRLAQDLGVRVSDANEFLSLYFDNFSGVRAFIDNTIEEVKKTTFTTTLLGHKRFFPSINDSNKNVRSAAERAAVNSIIQGSAADILKLAMIKITKEIQDEDVKLLLNVHDELIFELPESKVDTIKTKVEDIMTHAVKLDVPLRVSVETAHSWGEMH